MRTFLFLFAVGVAGLRLAAGETRLPTPAVWPVEIEISAHNAARLRDNPREFVRATVRIRDETVRDAGVRLKGRGSFQVLDAKPSFTIDFARFDSQPQLHGLRKIHLNNSAEDASFVKELIGSEFFQAVGIPAPRVGHARVSLNGKAIGLYVIKEGFTKDFLQRHFHKSEKGAGNLYDTDEGNDIDKRMEQDLGTHRDQGELKRLAEAASDPDLGSRWSRLQTALDMDRFITFMAAEIMICHWDGYCLSRNNFRVFYEGARHTIVFLPAGMDQIFSKADLTWKPKMLGLVARSVLETQEGREMYEREFRKMFESAFDAGRLTNRVWDVIAELRPFLSRGEFELIEGEAGDLMRRIEERKISLHRQLGEAEPQFLKFVDGVAILSGWKPFDEPAGGRMTEDSSGWRIVAGPRTAASWRTTIRLKPGRYIFSGTTKTTGVEPLPFGNRNGASLRIVGDTAQSTALTGSTAETLLQCAFEAKTEGEVVLAFELRASAGKAEFQKGVKLEVLQEERTR